MTTKITEQNISELANAGVNWQAVFTGDGSTGLTAVAGRGYFIDTTSGTVTVTLPASPSAGDVVVLKDYARTWATNSVTIASTTFDGVSTNPSFYTIGQTVTLVYMDGTKGWSLINEDTTTDLGAAYVSATGGTVTTSGDYKIHTFTGDGCFVVSCGGNPAGSTSVDYLVVAGGAGGGSGFSSGGGAGGAGGFRFYANPTCNPQSGPGSPLNAPTGLPVSATTYPITVGAGGAGAPQSAPTKTVGGAGSNSIFSTITSTGGGGGGSEDTNAPIYTGAAGGSGGGGGYHCGSGGSGSGNTPPVSPPQGNAGGTFGGPNPGCRQGGGGGGALAAGVPGNPSSPAPTRGNGGAGAGVKGFGTSGENCGSHYYFSGGGGGQGQFQPRGAGDVAKGGIGGGGNGSDANSPAPQQAEAGTPNTGGGGGGMTPGTTVVNGGKGIVVIRYKFR